MNRVARHLLGSVVLGGGVLSVVACGDVYADPQVTVTETEPDKLDASAFGFQDARVGPLCPSTRPRENTVCTESGVTCEYGRSSDPLCNAVLVCRGAESERYWDPQANDGCFTQLCPVNEDVSALDGKPCTIEGATTADEAVCNMRDGVCACTTGRDGATVHDRKWICVRPVSVCPPNRPLAGQPCEGTLWCDYGSCGFKRGLLMECKDSVWITGGAPCQ